MSQSGLHRMVFNVGTASAQTEKPRQWLENWLCIDKPRMINQLIFIRIDIVLKSNIPSDCRRKKTG